MASIENDIGKIKVNGISIVRRNNSYRFTVAVGLASDKKQVRKTMTFKPTATTPAAIRKEVSKAAGKFRAAVLDGQYLAGDKMTFEKFVEEYYMPQWAAEQVTPSTREAYYDMITRYAYPVFRTFKINQIKPLHVRGIVDDMKKRGLAPKTIKYVVSAISSVFSYAVDSDVVKENPCLRVKLPKLKADTELHYFTVPQAKAFLAAVGAPRVSVIKAHERTDDTGKPYHVPEYTGQTYTDSFQWSVYFNLAIYGGFRRGELVALQWRDIDFTEKTITVRRAAAKSKDGQYDKDPKTKKGIRCLHMPAESMNLLRTWKAQQKEISVALGDAWEGMRGKDFDKNYVFMTKTGGQMNLDTPQAKFHKIIDRYNRDIDKAIEERTATPADKLPRIRLHDLRHTCATLLISEGMNIETISQRMGHADTSTTLDIYGHALPAKDQEAADILERLFG